MTEVIAHRGYSAKFPENTMKAFIEAENANADGIELDVQLSKDGEVVVIHDEKLNRTTSGRGYVKDFTLEELKKLDAGILFPELTEKQTIPTLKEVLAWLNTNSLTCNIELKNGVFRYEGMEEKVIQLVREYHLSERIVLSSFNHYSIVYCYRHAPEIEIAPLLSEGLYMPWVYAASIQAKGYHPHYLAAPNEVITPSLESRIAVRPYTVNKEEEMERLFEIGCSAFITDYPTKAIELRKRYKKDKA
jgi:glycerophosphoryl diester phosphodiesterase